MRGLWKSQLWQEAVDEALDEALGWGVGLGALASARVLVTGGSGLVCSPVVDLLLRREETEGGAAVVYAAARTRSELEARFGPLLDGRRLVHVPYDATAADNALPHDIDYVIHGAGIASPDAIVRQPVETMVGNLLGVRELLEHARRAGARLLYVSSSEVYGTGGRGPFREGDYGRVELLDPRSSYPEGKRAAETLCASYLSEHGVDSVIVRPGHIYGPTASPADRRVASAWAWAAARGEDVVMKSDGAQVRSYVHCLDCATAMLTALASGESGRAYNVSNPSSVVSIRDMAELLAANGGVALTTEAPTDMESKSFNPMPDSSLDASALLALGWRGAYDANRGFGHTVAVLRELL